MTYARWAEKKEIKQNLTQINKSSKIEKSGIPILYDNSNLYIDDSISSNLVIASNGSGKTQTIILPLLKLSVMAKESILLLDPLGEIYKETNEELIKNDYNTIKIDFKSDNTSTWNPLNYPLELIANGKETEGKEMISSFAYYLFYDIKNRQTNQFWINSAQDYLIGLIFYLYDKTKRTNINLREVYDLGNKINTEENISKVLQETKENIQIYANLKSILSAPYETRESIIAVFNQLIKQYIIV